MNILIQSDAGGRVSSAPLSLQSGAVVEPNGASAQHAGESVVVMKELRAMRRSWSREERGKQGRRRMEEEGGREGRAQVRAVKH